MPRAFPPSLADVYLVVLDVVFGHAENEGGVTSYVGGCRLLIIPAGYVGAAIWGSIFVMFSGGRKTATGAAGVLIGMLLTSLCYAPNRTMVCLNLGYAILTSLFVYLEWWVLCGDPPILNFIVRE